MAKTNILLIFNVFFFSLLIAGKSQDFSRKLSPKDIGLKKEKLSHFHFFFHDIVSGSNPTAVRVAEANVTKTSPTGFGAVVVMDNALTLTPELSSKQVGRAQGIYAPAAMNEAGLLMVFNFAFTEGKYNGSTLSVLGRNAVNLAVREMPVLGGSGLLRFARGYAQLRTHSLNVTSGDAVVEFNVYVFHY